MESRAATANSSTIVMIASKNLLSLAGKIRKVEKSFKGVKIFALQKLNRATAPTASRPIGSRAGG
jgi:hypothetical protein